MRIFDHGYSNGFDGPGMRLIFYLKGCNFCCDWCGAPEGIASAVETLYYPDRTVRVGEEITPEAVVRKACAARDFIAGVSFGGGEPTLQIEELLTALELLHREHIHTAVESNASTEAYGRLIGKVDWLFSDLKTLSPEVYRRSIHADGAGVRDNLKRAAAGQKAFVLRIPVIHGVNDDPASQAELAEFCAELAGLRKDGLTVELLRQHHLAVPKYRALHRNYPAAGQEPPSRENLEHFAALLRAAGVAVTIFA